MCHTHKTNATEVTKIWLKWPKIFYSVQNEITDDSFLDLFLQFTTSYSCTSLWRFDIDSFVIKYGVALWLQLVYTTFAQGSSNDVECCTFLVLNLAWLQYILCHTFNILNRCHMPFSLFGLPLIVALCNRLITCISPVSVLQRLRGFTRVLTSHNSSSFW